MNTPNHIAVLGFRPGAGGIARVMVDLISGWQALGVHVDLLLPPGDYPDLAAVVQPPTVVKIHDAAQLQAYCATQRPDALLSNKDHTSAWLAASAVDAPWWCRIGSDVREKIARQPFWRRRAYAQGLRHTYRHASGLIANSQGVADSLKWLLGADCPPLCVIPNPLDLARLQRLAAAPVTHPWFQSRGQPLIVGCGRLVAVKDFAGLIDAVAKLRCHHSNARLVIFGEGRQRAALQRHIRRQGLTDVVDLPGFTDNFFAHVSRADLFVLSSRYEGSPNVLIEALACGAPCVATDCRSGPAEILEQGRYGQLVPVGDRAALAEAMAATLADPGDAATRMAAIARRFDRHTNALAYLQALS